MGRTSQGMLPLGLNYYSEREETCSRTLRKPFRWHEGLAERIHHQRKAGSGHDNVQDGRHPPADGIALIGFFGRLRWAFPFFRNQSAVVAPLGLRLRLFGLRWRCLARGRLRQRIRLRRGLCCRSRLDFLLGRSGSRNGGRAAGTSSTIPEAERVGTRLG